LWRELELLKCENAVLQRELAEHKNGGSTIASRTTTTPLIRLKEVNDLFADFTGEKDNFEAIRNVADDVSIENAMKVAKQTHERKSKSDFIQHRHISN